MISHFRDSFSQSSESPGSPETNVVELCRVLGLWEKAVESEVAKHTEAVKIDRGILFVQVDNSAWAQELNFLRYQIMARLNSLAGKEIIKDIRFKVTG